MKKRLSPGHVALLAKDSLMFCGQAPMVIPSGGSHTRSVEFRVPALKNEKDNPVVVTATVYAPKSVGTMFNVYSIKVNGGEDDTQVAIEAQNVQIGQESSLEYLCNVVVVGSPRKRNARSAIDG